MFKTLVLSALASTALAHYHLEFPTPRGSVADTQPQFCGGYPNVGERQPFPLKDGPIRINSGHTLATVWAFIATKPNPASLEDFNTTADGTSIPLLTDAFQIPSGEACWKVDFEKLNIGLKNGSEVTLQLQYDGGDSKLYQCSDLLLLSDYQVPSNETCATDAAAAFSATAAGGAASATGSGSASASASGSASSGAAAAASSAPAPGSAASMNAVAVGTVGLASLVLAQAVLL